MNQRIALLCQHFYPEMVSTGMHMTELATGLARRGWHMAVYTAPPSWGKSEDSQVVTRRMEYEGVEILRGRTIGSQRGGLLSRSLFALSYLLSALWGVLGHLRRYHALVVTTNPPFIGLVGWLIQRLTGKPYLVIVYDVYPDIAAQLGVIRAGSLVARLWEWLTRLILRRADTVVVIGRDMAEIVAAKLHEQDREKIVLIPNWSDEQHVTPIPQEQNSFVTEHDLRDRFVVQYAGRMGRTHNTECLIEAARLLADEPVLFQFIGDGAKKAILQQMVADYGLSNVQFLPYQPMTRLAEMLSAASLAVVCLESTFTGLSVPSKTYGVMAAGKPILAFLDPASEIGLTIAENRCGIVLSDPDGGMVADSIRNLLRHPDELLAMRRRSRDAFLANYTLSHAVSSYAAALCRMMPDTKPKDLV